MRAQTLSMSEHPGGFLLWLSALQWFGFMLTSCLTIPIVLAHDLGLSIAGTSMYIAKTLLACGAIAIAQVWWGHRLPILEGPSGLWWGVFLVLIQTTDQVHGNIYLMQRDLEMGLIISGLVLVLLVVFRLMGRVAALFNPVVTGTYLILLTLQMASSLISGVFGVGYMGRTTVNWKIAVLSAAIIVLVYVITSRAQGKLRSFSILLGLGLGWVVFAVFGLTKFRTGPVPWIQLPQTFPFGAPHFQLGIVLTCVVTIVVLLSNLVASMNAFDELLETPLSSSATRRGTLFTGLGTMLSGLFGVIGNVPITSSAGFISLTRIASKRPFIIAASALVVLGFLPKIDLMAANLPAPVAYSILLIIFAEMFGVGIKMLRQGLSSQRDMMGVGIAIVAGMGFQWIPSSAWGSVSTSFAYLLHNGLIIGVIIILLFQHAIPRGKVQREATPLNRDTNL